MKEIEAKLKLSDLLIIKKANLIKIKEVNVLDIYFDNEFLKFKSQDKVFRLRKENDKCYIAFKGPREKHNNLIVREEIEPEISSFSDALTIIKNLNLNEIAKVEKIRTYFSIKKYPNLVITIDKYPFIGTFIEIEGSEDEVYAFLNEFNFDLKTTIQKNCAEIFIEYCKKNNLPFEKPEIDFTFQKEADFNNGQNN